MLRLASYSATFDFRPRLQANIPLQPRLETSYCLDLGGHRHEQALWSVVRLFFVLWLEHLPQPGRHPLPNPSRRKAVVDQKEKQILNDPIHLLRRLMQSTTSDSISYEEVLALELETCVAVSWSIAIDHRVEHSNSRAKHQAVHFRHHTASRHVQMDSLDETRLEHFH